MAHRASPANAIEVFTDGAFSFAHPPAFGWVALKPGRRRPFASGSGSFANDGSNNFAAEARAALEALRWAAGSGYREVRLHTDFATLDLHLQREREPRYREVRSLRDFVHSHPEIQVSIIPTSSEDPHLTRAHHLARAAVN